ncbi:MAG: Ig-like domain-containing protein [Ignavibacteria bacterium]|nr:Ig-like domain-containing protein [Ignavibacteria bacterium]
MKRLFGLVFFVLLLAPSQFAQPPNLSGLTFCIDPGHGGHNPANDRLVIPDPGIEFWESESNFQKALLLDTLLTAQGATVILTRYTNDYPNDDEPSLSARVQIANANNVDWFHSIHSNAFNGSANYTLLLVRESTSSPGQPESPEAYAMSQLISPEIHSKLRTTTSFTRLDFTFLGFRLGVLNGLLMPGQLSEGSFHDFLPETRRLMNNDYRKMEAYAIRNAIMQYYLVPADTLGIAAGIQSEQGTGRILNGTLVRLLPENTVYSGDYFNNGFYMFDDVAAGSHTVRFETPGFILDSAVTNITVGATQFIDRPLQALANPTITSSIPSIGDTLFAASDPISINFSKAMDTMSVLFAFSIAPYVQGSLRWYNSSTLLVFDPDSLLPFNIDFVVRIEPTAQSASGEPLDGNGDGFPGDPFILPFRTRFVDVIPSITGTYPAPNQQNVAVYRSINIDFDRPMDRVSTQSAFSMSPPVAGSFNWSSDDQTMTFDPAINLANSESYSVTLARTATSGQGWPLGQELQFAFTTSALDTAGPRVVRSYPRHGINDVSSFMSFQIWFDEPVIFSSFATRVWFYDLADTNTTLPLGGVNYVDVGEGGLLTFEPWDTLEYGHSYRLSFLPGLSDPLGNLSTDETRIEFIVQATPFVQGPVLDPFENNSAQWQQPVSSPGTVGVDTTVTVFNISSTQKKSGSYSGELRYTYTDSTGGVCRLLNGSAPSVQPSNGWLGCWVFGDNSSNQLEYWFTTNSGDNEISVVGPIDWYGWRFLFVPIAGAVTTFNSVVVRQISGADLSAVLYFDDLQTETPTSVQPGVDDGHKTFVLHQNYPNPFNPATTIRYALPTQARVKLKIYNILGQEIVQLRDELQSAGNHNVAWNGRNQFGSQVASGVYFYRIEAKPVDGGDVFLSFKKMLMLK